VTRALSATLLVATTLVLIPVFAGAASPVILDLNVAQGSDDAEEAANGSVNIGDSDLELVLDGSLQTVGIRFVGVSIPPGSSVTSAWIQFETDEVKSATTSLTIQAQAADNPVTFARKTRNVSLRARTAASVAWAPVPWTLKQERGINQRTPNLSGIVSEVVARPGWKSGNALAFIITGSGVRTAEAYNGTRPPALHLEYTPPGAVNQPPTVSAGADATVRLPDGTTLTGATTDDGLPVPPGATTVQWSPVSGPGVPTFADPTARSTTATFPTDGVYTLRLTANDGALAAFDDVVVTVLAADAGPPSAPAGLSATPASGRRVDLSWQASVDDIGVTTYDVVRDGQVIASPSTTSFADTTVTPETSYSYWVVAHDAVGHSSDPSETVSVVTPAAASSITFGAAGDFGANAVTAATLAKLDSSDAEFFLALGDLDYDQTPTDAAWCDYVTSHLPTLGPSFPFELVSGNHEQDGGEDGWIMNHAACLPDRMGSTLGPAGDYAAEYAFDYPATTPLVRVIMTSPGLIVDGEHYDYLAGDAHYTWLSNTIDDARASGIPWVIVGMHHPCLSAGNHGCNLSKAFHNLMIAKHVDLVLQGHDHNYQRSKQLATNPTTCPAVPTGTYDADCVVDTGADHTYIKGAGSLFLISGTGGRPDYAINSADVQYPYFAVTDAGSTGFVRYTVTQDRLDATFVAGAGGFTDTFSILQPGSNQPPAVDAGPDRVITQPNAAQLAGSVLDDGGPVSVSWSVASGPGAVTFANPIAPATSATFSDPGTYVLRLSANDGATTATDETTVRVAAAGGSLTIEVAVSLSSDDAEENVASGAVDLSSSDLELVTDGSITQLVGLRFAGLQIPAGSQVTAAWVQFETDELKSAATSLQVQAQAADDALTFKTTAFDISSRPRTSAWVTWTPPAWSILQERGADQRTPDLAAVLQEVISRPGWVSGKAIAIVITGSGVRTAEAFNGTAPPVLHVEYAPPA
jgi:Calcineurin-like phosphoesterase/PKD domain